MTLHGNGAPRTSSGARHRALALAGAGVAILVTVGVVACQEQGVDAFELNLSCPHMDRVDMGSNIGKNVQLIDTVVRAVKDVARKPVWVKLTPNTTDIVPEAGATFRSGADAVSSSNTFTALPLIAPDTLEF